MKGKLPPNCLAVDIKLARNLSQRDFGNYELTNKMIDARTVLAVGRVKRLIGKRLLTEEAAKSGNYFAVTFAPKLAMFSYPCPFAVKILELSALRVDTANCRFQKKLLRRVYEGDLIAKNQMSQI